MPRGVDGDNPFALTEEEIKSLEPNYKKPKHKVNSKIRHIFGSCSNFRFKLKA